MMDRRDFLRAGLLSAAGLCLSSCHKGDKTDAGAVELAELHYDPRSLADSLERIRLWHEKNRPWLAGLLKPGLRREEIERMTSHLPFRLPDEACALYMWRDGTAKSETDDWPPFIWYHRFMSLEDAVSAYGSMGTVSRWKRSWFPLFDFQEEYYYIDCSASAAKALPVWHWLLEDPNDILSFTNLTTMMNTAALWYEKGAVGVKEGGGFTEDLKELKRIHNALNPGAVFPFYVGE